MSRAERKLARLKAEEELKKIKEGKKQKQQQDWENTKKQWAAMPKGVKTTLKVIGVVVALFILVGIFTPSENKSTADDSKVDKTSQSKQKDKKEESKPKTKKEIMLGKITDLIDSKDAFDAGSYVKGDIPKGEYAFVPFDGSGEYYSEEDSSGNIIDNENFDSFGYVYVHSSGNIQTRGVLIKVNALKKLGADGAKEVYEKLNDVSNYKEGAVYKVGSDIAPGTYTIESLGSAYVEVMSGPVGNNSIVDNENFNGKYSVNVSSGQYLKVSRGKLL